MIEAIPNQPIAFDDSRLRGCCSIDPEDCLLVDNEDTLTWQVIATRCEDDDQVIGDPGFDTGTDWDAEDGWLISDGKACRTVGPFGDILGNTLTETGYEAIPGTLYEIYVLVDSSTARTGVSVYFGGMFLGNLTAAGEYTFYVTATSTAGLSFIANLSAGESICIEAALVWVRTMDFTIEFVDQSGTVVETVTYADDIATMTLFEDRLTVALDLTNDDLDIPDGCYTIQFTDGCDETVLISQCVNIGSHDCTIVLSACGNSNVLGFKDSFSPQMRVVADLKRPTFEYEFGEERLSSGILNRYYAERTRTMELRVSRVGEFAHNFLSGLPLWDHFYIAGEEYVITSNTYEPGYEDVYSATGAVLLNVTPYQEDARKVRCEEDFRCEPSTWPPRSLRLSDATLYYKSDTVGTVVPMAELTFSFGSYLKGAGDMTATSFTLEYMVCRINGTFTAGTDPDHYDDLPGYYGVVVSVVKDDSDARWSGNDNVILVCAFKNFTTGDDLYSRAYSIPGLRTLLEDGEWHSLDIVRDASVDNSYDISDWTVYVDGSVQAITEIYTVGTVAAFNSPPYGKEYIRVEGNFAPRMNASGLTDGRDLLWKNTYWCTDALSSGQITGIARTGAWEAADVGLQMLLNYDLPATAGWDSGPDGPTTPYMGERFAPTNFNDPAGGALIPDGMPMARYDDVGTAEFVNDVPSTLAYP